MKSKLLIAIALGGIAGIATSTCSASTTDTPVVSTDRGKVSGKLDGGVSAYLGIPYAAPPVDKSRWREPQRAAAWKNTRLADKFGPSCPQAIVPGGFGPWTHEYVPSGETSEDCLSLNVWTPANATKKKLPVLVWIHGGGFTSGSASVPVYDGAALAREGIVVVSVNYRLGLLGFLGSEEFRTTGGGNFGLQDQLAALRWIQGNIGAFGGDPKQVTIAGQSAGGMSVHSLILSPLAKGLFARAIPQSGVGLGLDASLLLGSRAEAEKGAAALLDAAGAKSIAEARKLPLSSLSAALMKLGRTTGALEGLRQAPYADGAVLPVDPATAFAEGRYNDTPIMIGLTADEGSGLNLNYRVSDPTKYEALLRARTGDLADAFADFYPAASASKSFPALIRDGGIVSVLNWADLRAKTSQAPLYAYMWTHVEPGPKSEQYGAFHTSEVPYVFQTLDKAPERGFTDEDRRIASIVSRYWVNFVKTGDPDGASIPTWPRYVPGGMMHELGGKFDAYPPLDPDLVALFQKLLASGKSLLVF